MSWLGDNLMVLFRRCRCNWRLLFISAAMTGVLVVGSLARSPAIDAPIANLSSDKKLHRLIVLTDIENEPDDTQSMVRLMLYSDVIDIKGLIATTSTHMRTAVWPDSIRKVIKAYGKVRGSLIKHDPNYPTADALLSLVKQGLPVYGLQGVGEGKNSEGSDWIVRTLEQDDDRPLWVSVWGGANTLAQSLYQIQKSKSEAEAKRLVSKLRVYTISDQDDTGIWIRKNFPALFYIVSPGGYGAATWGGINQQIVGIDNTTVSNRWLTTHIQQGHGPLGAEYLDVAYGYLFSASNPVSSRSQTINPIVALSCHSALFEPRPADPVKGPPARIGPRRSPPQPEGSYSDERLPRPR